MISTIIPCYNAARHLAAAIESVLAQTVRPDEVIIVNDGSTDGSDRLAARFGGCVRVISQRKLGVSSARNAGLDAARGDLITFLDADDLWPEHSLASRLAMLAPDVGMVAGKMESFMSDELTNKERSTMRLADVAFGRVAGALLVRRTVFDTVGGFNAGFSMGETLDWVARASAADTPTAWADCVVLLRRVHANNTVHRSAELKREYVRVLRASLARRRAHDLAVEGGS